ncbi:MAG: hypothetical protein QXU92_00870 [Candidatus Diapherotrites archaeon]
MKGQMFSIDVLLAAGIIVLGIGIILGNYELITIQNKETRFSAEATTIATNAALMLLKKTECQIQTEFQEQGYKINNCVNISPLFSYSKEELLIPKQFKCYFEINDSLLNITDCDQKPDEKVKDISTIEIAIVSTNEELTKKDYEKCIANYFGFDCPLEKKTLKVYIWR